MTRKEADRLVLLKWIWLAKNSDHSYELGNRLVYEIPLLENLLNQCGYCEKYITHENKYRCSKCPIYKYDAKQGCMRKTSLYQKWGNDSTKENANEMLKFIKKVINTPAS
jgi:hypothetical protein